MKSMISMVVLFSLLSATCAKDDRRETCLQVATASLWRGIDDLQKLLTESRIGVVNIFDLIRATERRKLPIYFPKEASDCSQ